MNAREPESFSANFDSRPRKRRAAHSSRKRVSQLFNVSCSVFTVFTDLYCVSTVCLTVIYLERPKELKKQHSQRDSPSAKHLGVLLEGSVLAHQTDSNVFDLPSNISCALYAEKAFSSIIS